MRFLNERQGLNPFETYEAERPNIFVFTVDMIPPEFHREPSDCLPFMALPNLRSLQADSVCCRNAFSVSPLCGPSRASMFTGRYPYIFVNEERAHDGAEVELRPDDPIYPEYLRAVGYAAGHVGKSHIGTEKFMRTFGESCSPWNRWAPPIYDDPEYHQHLAERGIEGFRYARRIEGLKMDRKTPGNSYGGWIEQETGAAFPVEGTYPHYLVHRAAGLLDSLRRTHGPRTPLYVHVDLFAPHQPFLIPAGLEEREALLRKTVPLSEGYSRWLEGGCVPAGPEPRVYGTYRRSWGLYERGTAREYQIANMLQMEVIDLALGRFLARLTELGLYEDSIVVVTADHGEMNLEQGLIDKGVYGHPKAARIPMLIKLPGNHRAGTRVAADVCLLDLAPTFLDLAGVRPAARLDGENLLPFLTGEKEERREPFLFEAGWHIAPNPAVAVHGTFPEGHFRYVYNATSDIDELYDLDDPLFKNLIGEDSFSGVRKALRRRLAGIFQADTRWRCYRQCFELDRAEDLPVREGDGQMFVPE